jgi:hypothetical protein
MAGRFWRFAPASIGSTFEFTITVKVAPQAELLIQLATSAAAAEAGCAVRL